MSSKLEKLMFSIGMVDNTQKGAKSAMANIDKMQRHAKSGFLGVAGGAATLFAAGKGLQAVLSPAIEMDKAMGEVRSLGAQESALAVLEKRAASFSLQYGESATDFVRSAYDIQSAIAGLQGNDLAAFTNASNILAKGTKSDASTITNYMGTMYGIFQKNADKMGKSNWVEQITGQTALAVKMFKTTGSEMSAAFGRLGATGEAFNVSTAEQMAVLGTLQATMSGSEAATKYKAYLQGIGKAQDELGIKLTNSHGRMLPITDQLLILQNRLGDLSKTKNSDALKKAFGTKEAADLVTLLVSKTDSLGDSVSQIGNVKGMQQAEDMAKNMVDPFAQLGQMNTALARIIGRMLLPVLKPMIASLITGGEYLLDLADKYPLLAKVIGIATLALFAFTAAGGAFMLIMGLGKIAMAGWMATALLVKSIAAGLAIGLNALRWATLLFNAALWANPGVLIALAIAAAVLGVVAVIGLLIYHWDSFTNMISNWAGFKTLKKIAAFFGIGDSKVDAVLTERQENINKEAPALKQSRTVSPAIGQGGLMQDMSRNSTRSQHIEKVEIKADKVDNNELQYILASM